MGKHLCDSHIVTKCDIGHIFLVMSHNVTVTTCDEVDI